MTLTPFGSWSYDFSEAQATSLLADCASGGLLVTHSPPYGLCDLSSAGRHLGSTTVRKTIDSKRPKLVICGHIHDSWRQKQTVGTTVVINAGNAGYLIDLPLS